MTNANGGRKPLPPRRDYVAEAVLAHLWNAFPERAIRVEHDRVVTCDGRRLVMLPLNPADGQPFDLPTLKYLFQSFDEQVRALGPSGD